MTSYRVTFTERKPGETANDYNDRVIRHAAKWYNTHLKDVKLDEDKTGIKVVLLTNDMGNKEKAKQEGLLAYTGTSYCFK